MREIRAFSGFPGKGLFIQSSLQCSKENPIATHEALLDHIPKVKKEICVISPTLQKEWVPALIQLMDKEVKIEALFPENIMKKFAKIASDLGRLEDFDNNAKFYIYEDTGKLPATLASDSFGCFCTASKTAPHNYMDMKIYTTDPKSIKWNKDIYEHFKKQNKQVKLSDYL
jgi:predicted transcriptional regulator